MQVHASTCDFFTKLVSNRLNFEKFYFLDSGLDKNVFMHIQLLM